MAPTNKKPVRRPTTPVTSTRKPATPAVSGRNQPVSSGIDWTSVLENMAQSTAGEFFFIKSPKTKIKLLCFEESEANFYSPTQTNFKGKMKTKFVVFGIVMSTEGGNKPELGDNWKNKVVPLVITKTALTGIISLLVEGYDLFDPQEGYGITIIKTGSGTDTDYNVNPSMHPIAIDLADFELPEKSLAEFASDLSAKQAARGNGGPGSDVTGNDEASW